MQHRKHARLDEDCLIQRGWNPPIPARTRDAVLLNAEQWPRAGEKSVHSLIIIIIVVLGAWSMPALGATAEKAPGPTLPRALQGTKRCSSLRIRVSYSVLSYELESGANFDQCSDAGAGHRTRKRSSISVGLASRFVNILRHKNLNTRAWTFAARDHSS
jgi:hypothetical protein